MAEAPGIVRGGENYIPNFTLSRELLNGAVVTGIGPTSSKLIHPNFPGVLIRQLHPDLITELNKMEPGRIEKRTEETFIDTLRQSYRDNYSEVSAHGIEVTPFSVLQKHDGEISIVAHKVFGLPLEKALTRKMPGIIEGVDRALCGNVSYLRAARQRDGEYLFDKVGISQFMFGHYAGETEADDRVIFVDLDVGDDALHAVTELHKSSNLLISLITLAYDILRAEAMTGLGGLRASRRMVREELQGIVRNGQSESTSKYAAGILAAFDANDLELITAYEMD